MSGRCCASSACGAAVPVWLAAGVVVSLAALAAGVGDDGAGRRDAGGADRRRRAGGAAGAARARRRARRAALCRTAGDACRDVPRAGRSAGVVLPQSRAQHRRRPWASARQATCWPGWSATSRRSTGSTCASWCRWPARSCCCPVLVVLIGVHSVAAGARRSASLFAVAAFALPWIGARDGRARRRRAGHCHRRAAHRRARCADRTARGACLRRRGPHAGRGAGARGGAAGSAARTRRPHRAGQCAAHSCAARPRSSPS